MWIETSLSCQPAVKEFEYINEVFSRFFALAENSFKAALEVLSMHAQ